MTDIARMRFRNIEKPKERGMLVLSDDGLFRIEPSDEFRDEMARLEEEALDRAQTYGTGLGLVLLTLGALAVGIGWYVGRVFGKLGSSLSQPRPLREVDIQRDPDGRFFVRLHGRQHIRMGWNPDGFLQTEADDFIQKFQEMKNSSF